MCGVSMEYRHQFVWRRSFEFDGLFETPLESEVVSTTFGFLGCMVWFRCNVIDCSSAELSIVERLLWHHWSLARGMDHLRRFGILSLSSHPTHCSGLANRFASLESRERSCIRFLAKTVVGNGLVLSESH